MRIFCADCKRFMGIKEPIRDQSITHTLCHECAKPLREELEAYRARKEMVNATRGK